MSEDAIGPDELNGNELLNAIKNFLRLNYSPGMVRQAHHDIEQAHHDREASPPTPLKEERGADSHAEVFYMSTQELTRQLHELYPTDALNGRVVAEWMQELGFSFVDNGNMQLEWKMEKW